MDRWKHGSHHHSRSFGAPFLKNALSDSVGAISGCESILIRPTMTLELEGILQRIRALMPDAMFPREGDDADSLARRLGDCDFLDDIHCRKKSSRGSHRLVTVVA